MARNKRLHFLVVVLGLYFGAGIWILIAGRQQIDADMLSYVGVAQKYLRGEVADAINGFWGPMVSWLMLPFLALDVQPLLAVRIVSLLSGGVAILGVHLLSSRFEMSEGLRRLVLLLSLPIVLGFSGRFVGSDLLLAGIFLHYFYLIFDPDYPSRVRNAVLCGLFGALAYLTKGYGFHFFVVHFVMLNVLLLFAAGDALEKKRVRRNGAVGLLVFALLSSPWIYAISSKYHRPVVANTGGYNFAVVANPDGRGHPMGYQGLLDPPNASAVSIWEDPSYLEVQRWSPWQSLSAFKYEMVLIYRNGIQIQQALQLFCWLATAIVVAYALAPFVPVREPGWARFLYPWISMILYFAGYSLIQIQERYIWVGMLLLLLMGGSVLGRVLRIESFGGVPRYLLLGLFVLSFVVPAVSGIAKADVTASYGKDVARMAVTLGSKCDVQGRIASHPPEETPWAQTPLVTYWYYWRQSLYLAYHLGAQYYGTPRPEDTETEILDALQGKGIDYYLVWGDAQVPFLRRFSEKSGCEIPGLRVYALREEPAP